MKYETIIGLEFHVQLKTKTKMFCSCSNESETAAPDINICPICLGHPGVLPVVNDAAIKMAIKTSLALNCTINKFTKFDRKNYFYPDLPKGYQISQYDEPLAEHGYLDINFKAKDGLAGRLDDKDQLKRIGITRLHMEEDAAKNTHGNEGATLVDYNRAGSPLVEIVTEPDFKTPQEAKTFAQELQLLVRYLGISDAYMEKGHLRCDANISLRPEGETNLYPKTEVKNLNSFKAVERALTYEIARHKALWIKGQAPDKQETRGWDENKQETVAQRTKESEADYRYFPEPDIAPLTFTDAEIETIKRQLGELPQYKRARFMAEYDYTPAEAKILTHNQAFAEYTEEVISELREWLSSLEEVDGSTEEVWDKNKRKLTKLVSNWLINNLLSMMNEKKVEMHELKITAENFAEFISLVYQNKVNSTNAQKILSIMLDKGADPSHVLDEYDLAQIDDSSAIEKIAQNILEEHPEQVSEYKAGKEVVIKFFLGQVMRKSKGSANPQTAEELLKKLLS